MRLINGRHSAVVDLDDALLSTTGTMPGDPPHRFRVLFTAQKDGFLYLVANVQSHSPISDPRAPCGGDAPRGILWIRTDPGLAKREFQSEIYESCSYNYYDSKVKVTKTGLTINYGSAREQNALFYDNSTPELGLLVSKKPVKN
ncbi:MAG: hypothetical protein JO314_05440 [Acidobacteria bacterium]|nr:hypothetical protein [Acidobacteriota bacterium]